MERIYIHYYYTMAQYVASMYIDKKSTVLRTFKNENEIMNWLNIVNADNKYQIIKTY